MPLPKKHKGGNGIRKCRFRPLLAPSLSRHWWNCTAKFGQGKLGDGRLHDCNLLADKLVFDHSVSGFRFYPSMKNGPYHKKHWLLRHFITERPFYLSISTIKKYK